MKLAKQTEKLVRNLRLVNLLGVLVGFYLVRLYFAQTNQYYINTAYFNFNLLMGLLLLVLSLASLFFYPVSGLRQYLPTLLFILVAFMTPALPLSSATAAVRPVNLSRSGGELEVSPLLSKDPSTLKISEWARLFNYEPDFSRYKGQEVDVIGFVFKPEASNVFSKENFWVGRFVLTCCAVDASALGLEVETSENWPGDVSLDDWIRVSGNWELKERDGKQYLVVNPKEIVKVSQPDKPYEN